VQVPVALIGNAVGLFAATNVDDLVMLALFFGAATTRAATARVGVGQLLGFAGILTGSLAGAAGADLLPGRWIGYLGLVPLYLGLHAAWRLWAELSPVPRPGEHGAGQSQSAPGVLTVAMVTLANGGDNLGAYVPVFAAAGRDALLTYLLVFTVLLLPWCSASWLLARQPQVSRVLTRSGHLILPVVLVGLGLSILIGGGAFGL
jgi:cadmium resistance protein CadD (predicted permease)